MADGRRPGPAAGSAELSRAVRHRSGVSGLSGAGALARGLALRRLRPRPGLPPQEAADRGVQGVRQAALDPRRHALRADQDRPRALVSRDLPGDREQGRDLGHGAAAADGLRQLWHRLGVAAQDPPRHGRAGPQAAQRAGRGRRDPGRGPAGPAAARRARRWSPARSRAGAARRTGAGSAGCRVVSLDVLICTAHFPLPSIGRIARAGDAFRFVFEEASW